MLQHPDNFREQPKRLGKFLRLSPDLLSPKIFRFKTPVALPFRAVTVFIRKWWGVCRQSMKLLDPSSLLLPLELPPACLWLKIMPVNFSPSLWLILI